MIILSDFPPTAQKRPRVTRFVTYDPSKKDKAEFLKTVLFQLPKAPLTTAIQLQIAFKFARPKSHFKKNGTLLPSAPELHTKKPDIDNLIKFVLDALNGYLYVDDSQIISISASKSYASLSCIEIRIEEKKGCN